MRPGPNLKLGALLFLFVFIAGSLAFYGGAHLVDRENDAAAGAGDGAGEDGEVPSGPVSVRMGAQNLQFSPRSLSASTGAQVTVTLDNQDAGVLHNIAFYTNNRATQSIAVGELFPGVAQRDLRFTAPDSPGNYFFRCDVHPDTMTGTFRVQ